MTVCNNCPRLHQLCNKQLIFIWYHVRHTPSYLSDTMHAIRHHIYLIPCTPYAIMFIRYHARHTPSYLSDTMHAIRHHIYLIPCTPYAIIFIWYHARHTPSYLSDTMHAIRHHIYLIPCTPYAKCVEAIQKYAAIPQCQKLITTNMSYVIREYHHKLKERYTRRSFSQLWCTGWRQCQSLAPTWRNWKWQKWRCADGHVATH